MLSVITCVGLGGWFGCLGDVFVWFGLYVGFDLDWGCCYGLVVCFGGGWWFADVLLVGWFFCLFCFVDLVVGHWFGCGL